jgi:hypothetical protein
MGLLFSPDHPRLVCWSVGNVYYCGGNVGRWIATVEARTGQAAIRATAERLGYQHHKLIAIMAASRWQNAL